MSEAAEKAEAMVTEDVKSKFGDAVLQAEVQRKGRISIKVNKDRLADVARYLKDSYNFDHLASVSGTDYPDRKEFEVVYHVWSIPRKILAALRVSLPREDPQLDTLIPVWEAANLHERETHEMLGINFAGHPNLSGLLLPEDWKQMPPLRKDFKLPSKPR
ncbi:NADH-quinone oxidoreductase subunit C [Candidatus Hecatella orcuttiae]|uniref:NADH-quinone oxidoreductase subunit C n=1 Tax=Candidatus Hecatella orcuttiae TaxID=1935119 RepID=UPI002867B3D8|nr:NADH-quinone oxidoreductase subunit C [Candidatus Hecatella orcuttiae]